MHQKRRCVPNTGPIALHSHRIYSPCRDGGQPDMGLELSKAGLWLLSVHIDRLKERRVEFDSVGQLGVLGGLDMDLVVVALRFMHLGVVTSVLHDAKGRVMVVFFTTMCFADAEGSLDGEVVLS